MEWIGSLAATLVVFLLVIPAVVAVGSVILLGAVGWMSYGSPSVAWAGFFCPFSKRWVTTGFLTQTGSEEPSDVVSCSRFGHDGPVTCEKRVANQRCTAGWKSASACSISARFSAIITSFY